MFNNVYAGKRVFITGHTGFKGSWLSIWLLKMGAVVCGFSDCIPTQPSIFSETRLAPRIKHQFGDIRDLKKLQDAIEKFEPDFIFHLAAQAIVSASYKAPVETITTNVIGTVNLLEALRQLNPKCVVVMITSDKCYENIEWLWGYKETDHLGGRDVYSGSKGAAEVVIHAYYHSFFKSEECNVRIATGRAGNVIGGGDWAQDRIVADCMRNWSKELPVEIRSPKATRPWQHVLEPLSGYLTLASTLFEDPALRGESFNFGPKAEQSRTVLNLLEDLSEYWDFNSSDDIYLITDNIPFHEAGLLKLNCDKALFHLRWEANLNYMECVRFVSQWYYSYYKKDIDMYELTLSQINQFEDFATQRDLIWTN